MTRDPLPPFDAPDHPDLWVIRYLDATLSPAERAAFEAHMKVHEVCRDHVETMRVALPVFVRVLMENGPPKSAAEFLREAEERRKKR
jgi:anti-sigma factor RsiW